MRVEKQEQHNLYDGLICYEEACINNVRLIRIEKKLQDVLGI